MREYWAIRKDIFPEVAIHFIFTKGDNEFPSSIRVLFSGDRAKIVSGDDLAGIAIAFSSHMLRYIRESHPNQKLPEVCLNYLK